MTLPEPIIRSLVGLDQDDVIRVFKTICAPNLRDELSREEILERLSMTKLAKTAHSIAMRHSYSAAYTMKAISLIDDRIPNGFAVFGSFTGKARLEKDKVETYVFVSIRKEGKKKYLIFKYDPKVPSSLILNPYSDPTKELLIENSFLIAESDDCKELFDGVKMANPSLFGRMTPSQLTFIPEDIVKKYLTGE